MSIWDLGWRTKAALWLFTWTTCEWIPLLTHGIAGVRITVAWQQGLHLYPKALQYPGNKEQMNKFVISMSACGLLLSAYEGIEQAVILCKDRHVGRPAPPKWLHFPSIFLVQLGLLSWFPPLITIISSHRNSPSQPLRHWDNTQISVWLLPSLLSVT